MKTLEQLPADISTAEKMLYLCYTDLIAYGKVFLSGDFSKAESPPVHYEVADELNSDSRKPLAIILPRDSAKTTLVKCSIMHDFCYTRQNLQRFALEPDSVLRDFWLGEVEERDTLLFGWVSKSQNDSKNNIRYIYRNLEHNLAILKYFGNLKGKIWNREDITTRDGDRLISSSNLTSIRGMTEATMTEGAIRFSRAFLDDVENEYNTKTLMGRRDIRRIIFASIMPAIEEKRRCRLIIDGTSVHFDSIIQHFIEKYELRKKKGTIDEWSWRIICYPSTQPNLPGGVLWNARKPRHVLNQIKQRYIDMPELGEALYYQEYELEVQASEVSVWTRQHIKSHNGVLRNYGGHRGVNTLTIGGKEIVVNTFLGGDPATDIDTLTSDFSVIAAIAIDADNNRYHLRSERHLAIPTSGLRNEEDGLVGKKGFVDYYIDMFDEFFCTGGTIEDVAMNRSVFKDLMQRKMKLKKMYVIANTFKPGGTQKHSRVHSFMNTFFTQGMVYYRPESYNLMEETIRFGPRMAHDDEIEAFFLANRYAYPPTSAVKKEDKDEWTRPVRRKKTWIVA